MIDELNSTVWATLRPSAVHGVGVIAIRDIPQGQRVYAMGRTDKWYIAKHWNGLHLAIRTLLEQRWPLAFEGQPFQSPNDDARLTSFMNHSDTPNYNKFTDCALRDIAAGEEIFESYAPELDVSTMKVGATLEA